LQYSLNPNKIEKILAAFCNPNLTGKIPFTISILEDRDSSIEEAENAMEAIQVFTDGSAMEGKVGAAATLLREGSPPHTLHLHLGPDSEHTVHKAELVGILLGLHLIATERKGGTSTAIGMDNQAVLEAFHLDLRKPGHHLTRESMKVAYQIQNRRRKSKYLLTLRWMAGHEGIAGNEIVDQEAKKAAGGHSSDTTLLPSYLRKPFITKNQHFLFHLIQSYYILFLLFWG